MTVRDPTDRSAVEQVKAALTDVRMVVDRLGLSRGATFDGRRSAHVICPAPGHSEKTASCHVFVRGSLGVKCFGCDFKGDVFHLIAAVERLELPGDFRAVLERAAEIASISLPESGSSSDLEYPPLDEVTALWAAAMPVSRCPDASSWLASRGLDVATVARLDLARSVPVGAKLPPWARYNGKPWVSSGHRLLLPMYDGEGALRTLRARALVAQPSKAVPPSRHKMGGAVMASSAALTMLRGGEAPAQLVIAEGEPDYLTWATKGFASIGVTSGGWSGAHASRVTPSTTVLLWTDVDRAGHAFARAVADTLEGRTVLRRPLEDTRDVNDLHRAGALPADPAQGARPLAPPDEDPRPIIRIGPELHVTVDRALKALRGDADLYQRDGSLVHVTREVDGAPTIRTLQLATMRERLTSAARFEKRKPGRSQGDGDAPAEWLRCIPPDNVAHAVLARGQWEDLRTLVGVLEAPSLRPDGSVLDEPGYDRATRFLYAPRGKFPRVAERPDLAAARVALQTLESIFVDFPYRSPADRSVALAAALTLIVRPAIEGAVPAFLFDATTPGSGKTLQADAVSILATGRLMERGTFPVDNEEELEKVLAGYALAGAQIAGFDNVSCAFGGAPLDKYLTTGDTVKARVLGSLDMPSLRWRAVILATGNNLAWKGDTFRRVLVSKLEPTLENPEERVGFAHADLRTWVRDERPRLVVAALTLLRAYVVAGRPDVDVRSWGSFEAWSALIPRALVWAGAADPMSCRPAADVDAQDDERAQILCVMAAITRLQGDAGLTARGIVDALYPHQRDPGPPDGFDEAREAIEAMTKTQTGRRPDATRLGYALRRWKRRPVGGKRLDVVLDRTKLARWRVA